MYTEPRAEWNPDLPGARASVPLLSSAGARVPRPSGTPEGWEKFRRQHIGNPRVPRYSPAMDTDLKGEICALAAALTWATALVLFKRSGERVPPLPLNLFKNVTALILLVVTLALMGEGMDELRKFAVSDMVILSLSGFLGIAVADTTFFYALNLIGVGLVTIAECLYSPLIILFSILILFESLTVAQIIGKVIILAAV